MDLIRGADAPAPVLPVEEVDVPALGGAVRVRALWLSERLAMEARIAKLRAQHGTDDAAGDAAVYAVIPELLAVAVVDVQGNPVYTRLRWEHFGASNLAAALELFNAAWRISGLGGEDTKKN